MGYKSQIQSAAKHMCGLTLLSYHRWLIITSNSLQAREAAQQPNKNIHRALQQSVCDTVFTCIGFITSLMKVGWMYASRMCLCSRFRTVLVNLGDIFCGLKLTLNSGNSTCGARFAIRKPVINEDDWLKHGTMQLAD